MQLKIRGAVLEEIGRKRPFAESTPISISELDLESPGPGEILVKIEAAGLCHSDLSVVDGNRVRPVPMLLGHEAAGRIIELGDGVDSLSVGTRVVMTFLPRCGECAGCATDGRMPCTVGSAANNDGSLLGGAHRLRRSGENVKHHLGVSGFATHAVVNAKSVVPVDDDIPAEIAAVLGCAVLTGGGALLNAAKPRPADTVMVVGLGGVGMAAILTARALGSRTSSVSTHWNPSWLRRWNWARPRSSHRPACPRVAFAQTSSSRPREMLGPSRQRWLRRQRVARPSRSGCRR